MSARPEGLWARVVPHRTPKGRSFDACLGKAGPDAAGDITAPGCVLSVCKDGGFTHVQ